MPTTPPTTTLALASAAAATLLATTTPSGAQSPHSLTPTQSKALLEQLEALQSTLESGKKSNNARAIAAFSEAAASEKSAYDFFLACTKAVNFEAEDRRESEFRDWKNREDDLHESQEFRVLLRAQLRYLATTLKAAEAEELEDAIPAIEDFIEFYRPVDLRLVDPKTSGRITGRLRELASASVLGTTFAERFQLDATVQPPEGWPASPAEFDALYDAILLPHYRDKGNATALVNAWDERISHLKNIAAAHQEADSLPRAQEILTAKLPELQWGRGKDVFAHNSELAGAEALIAVVKANLTHPSASSWVDQLTALVSGQPDPSQTDNPPSDDDPATSTGDSTAPTLRDLLDRSGD